MLGPELVGELVRVRPLAERDADRTWELVQDAEALRLTGTTTTFTRAQVDEWMRRAGVYVSSPYSSCASAE